MVAAEKMIAVANSAKPTMCCAEPAGAKGATPIAIRIAAPRMARIPTPDSGLFDAPISPAI